MFQYTRLVIWLVSLLLVGWVSVAQAIGFGSVNVYSFLNEPLSAEIELLGVQELDVQSLKIDLASSADFLRAGIPRPFYLTKLKFELFRGKGKTFVYISSKNPIKQPFIEFLLELKWPEGRLIKAYTLLLEPMGAGNEKRPEPMSLQIKKAPVQINRKVKAQPTTQTNLKKVTKPKSPPKPEPAKAPEQPASVVPSVVKQPSVQPEVNSAPTSGNKRPPAATSGTEAQPPPKPEPVVPTKPTASEPQGESQPNMQPIKISPAPQQVEPQAPQQADPQAPRQRIAPSPAIDEEMELFETEPQVSAPAPAQKNGNVLNQLANLFKSDSNFDQYQDQDLQFGYAQEAEPTQQQSQPMSVVPPQPAAIPKTEPEGASWRQYTSELLLSFFMVLISIYMAFKLIGQGRRNSGTVMSDQQQASTISGASSSQPSQPTAQSVKTQSTTSVKPAKSAPQAKSSEPIEVDLPEAETEDSGEEENIDISLPEEADLSLGAGDFDLPDDLEESFEILAASDEELKVKLDLAKKYVEAGDKVNARMILEEIAASNSGDLQKEAQTLLNQL